ncbi:secreted protein [Streptomyces iranensis]|nr:secreted protein [Streptomyces iranensis]
MGAAASLAVAGCSSGSGSGTPKPAKTTQAKPIGDGSTSHGERRKEAPKPERLERGQKPPQFVVFSWDGAGEVGNGLFPRFRKLAQDHGVTMTFFLSGIYCLPESKKSLYRPPNNPVGASDIGYLTDEHIKATLRNVREAWLEGHEIGTHFNGHFCSGSGSVENWTSAQWKSEIDQAMSFVTEWRTNTRFTDVDPLPFDYHKELIGGRTPCLKGQTNLLPTARELGWRYDASSPGGLQVWPSKKQGVWDFPLQQIPFPGHSFEVLSMDYNILANQSKNSTNAPPANYPGWRKQAAEAYIAGFKRAYETNRAPFFIGNHFEEWNGGIYMDAVEEALKHMADEKHEDVRLVSFKQLTDWMDAQDPAVLDELRGLGVGQAWSANGG